MNAQEAIEICSLFADDFLTDERLIDHDDIMAVVLFIKQQQNTIVNLRLADKEEISELKAENARFEKKLEKNKKKT